MSDYWDHPEYGELEAKLEAQVKTTRVWMAKHDDAVEREALLSCEVTRLKALVHRLQTTSGEKLQSKLVEPLSDRLERRGFTKRLDRICGNPYCEKRFSTRDLMQMYCSEGCKPPGPPDPPPGGPMPKWGGS